jgi:dihydrofolate synthase/folylpolyglutamate synthase
MNYVETVNWMFSQLPMYQNQGKAAYKSNLDNILKLSKYLKHPEQKFKSVHVAGTNGKGSTSHMIASVLQEAGYKVGLYTSPHLKDFRERVKINGKCVSKQFVIQFIKRNRSFFEENSLSFFEMTVGMAFDYFAKKNVDIAIVEVGLGGRLDSTNVITPEISVITNIGLDHTQFLGNTLEAIAREKAGIIKPKVLVVIGETQKETKPVFDEIALENSSSILYADEVLFNLKDSELQINYQNKNIKTSVMCLKSLQLKKWQISDKHIEDGILNVVKNTRLLGRWQILQHDPKVICDTAHNREGLRYTLAQLKNENFLNLHFVLGSVNDKDVGSIIELFPKKANYYFCKPRVKRGMEAQKLHSAFVQNGYKGKVYSSVVEAYENALIKAKKEDVIYVGGSTFVVAEILQKFDSNCLAD